MKVEQKAPAQKAETAAPSPGTPQTAPGAPSGAAFVAFVRQTAGKHGVPAALLLAIVHHASQWGIGTLRGANNWTGYKDETGRYVHFGQVPASIEYAARALAGREPYRTLLAAGDMAAIASLWFTRGESQTVIGLIKQYTEA